MKTTFLISAAVVSLCACSGVAFAQPPQTPYTLTIALGTYSTVANLTKALEAEGPAGSARARSMLKTMTISRDRIEVEAVIVSVRQLGLADHASYADIVAAGRKMGLDLCPGEMGPQLRLQYRNQNPDESLRIAMEPVMSGITPAPTVFSVAGGSLLAHNSSFAPYPDDRWVFVRRK